MMSRFAAGLFLVSLSSASFAATDRPNQPTTSAEPVYSSSTNLPEAPGRESVRFAAGQSGSVVRNEVSSKPFSALAVAVKVGTLGIGFDIATPLAKKFNLRAGASFFSYSPNITEDGINVNGTLTFRSGTANLDWFPFGNAFRVSPGVTFYNGNSLKAVATVPGGQTFDLNDTTYTSSKADPVTGTFNVLFGNKAAPSLTIGTGNMLPRKAGKHWSVPFEFGAEFTSSPTLTLALAGSACDQFGNCSKIATNPTTQANVLAEQKKLQDDISPLQAFPIISIGLGYKF
jgi:hypothetical protein